MSLSPNTGERSPEIVNNSRKMAPDNEGGYYELRGIALVFLRCRNYKIPDFKLMSEKTTNKPPEERDWGRFDDIVLTWSDNSYGLYVQLKHKTEDLELKERHFFRANEEDFNIEKYYKSFLQIKKRIGSKQYALVLSTNATLADNARDFFTESKTNTFAGADLLDVGGIVYQLNPSDKKVQDKVENSREFMEHFFLFCRQHNNTEICEDINVELGRLLGPMDTYETVFDELIKSVKDWKFYDKKQSTQEPLDRTWSKWRDIVRRQIDRDLVDCCNALKTTVEFDNVDDIRKHIESANPAYVPYSAGTMRLMVTKVHQAICKDTHILVNVKRLKESLERVLQRWGPFCRWLVLVVDDPEETQESSNLINKLTRQLKEERRLVVVTMADEASIRNNSVVVSPMTAGKTSGLQKLDSKLTNLRLS